jgi:hypothetical protein
MKASHHRVAVIVVSLVLNVLILEIGLRLLGRIPSNKIEGFFMQHGAAYGLQVNLAKHVNEPSFSYVAYTNSLGLRDRKEGYREVKDKTFDVFLGDSATFGNGVNYEESFVGIYGNRSRPHGVEVLNLAVGGHYLKDQLERLQDLVESKCVRPRIVFICVNARLIEGYDRKNNGLIVKNGYLFPKQGWVLPYIKVTLSNISAAYGFFRDGIRNAERGFVDPVEGELKSAVGFYSLGSPLAVDENFRCRCTSVLDSLTDYCRKLSVRAVYVYLPMADLELDKFLDRAGLDKTRYNSMLYSSYMKHYCKSRNLTIIDLTDPLRVFVDTGHRLSFEMDSHYNRDTNRLIGDYIATAIASKVTSDH